MAAPALARKKLDNFVGLNNRDEDGRIGDDDLNQCENFDPTEGGNLTKRSGFRHMTGGSVGGLSGVTVVYLGVFKTTTYTQIIAVQNSSDIIFSSDGGANWTIAYVNGVPGVHVGNARFGIQYAGIFYIVREDNYMIQWNGSILQDITGSPTGTTCAVYKDRMFVCNTFHDPAYGSGSASRLWYSDIAGTGGTTFQTANWHALGTFIDVSQGDGDGLVGLQVYQDRFLIFKSRSIWDLSVAPNPIDWALRNISLDIGCVSCYTLREVEGAVMFLATKGLYRTDGMTMQEISSRVSTMFVDHNVGFLTPYRTLNRDSGAFYDNKYFLSLVLDPLGVQANDRRLYVYFTKLQAWSRYTIAQAFSANFTPSNMLEVNDPHATGKKWAGLLVGSALADGNTWRYGNPEDLTMYADGGSPYGALMETKEFDLDDPVSVKRGKWIVLEAQLGLTNGTTLLENNNGTFGYNLLPLSSGVRDFMTIKSLGMFRTWKVFISNTDTFRCVIYSVTLSYVKIDKRLAGA